MSRQQNVIRKYRNGVELDVVAAGAMGVPVIDSLMCIFILFYFSITIFFFNKSFSTPVSNTFIITYNAPVAFSFLFRKAFWR